MATVGGADGSPTNSCADNWRRLFRLRAAFAPLYDARELLNGGRRALPGADSLARELRAPGYETAARAVARLHAPPDRGRPLAAGGRSRCARAKKLASRRSSLLPLAFVAHGRRRATARRRRRPSSGLPARHAAAVGGRRQTGDRPPATPTNVTRARPCAQKFRGAHTCLAVRNSAGAPVVLAHADRRAARAVRKRMQSPLPPASAATSGRPRARNSAEWAFAHAVDYVSF